MATEDKIPLFVYGSLKRNFRAHERMLADMEFVGEFSCRGYLLDLGSFPGIVLGGDNTTLGEVYHITETRLKSIDHYEGEGFLYKRKQVTCKNNEGKEVNAWTYEIMNPGAGRRYGYESWNKGRINGSQT